MPFDRRLLIMLISRCALRNGRFCVVVFVPLPVYCQMAVPVYWGKALFFMEIRKLAITCMYLPGVRFHHGRP